MTKKEDFNEWADTPIRPMRRSLSIRSVKNLDKKTIPSKVEIKNEASVQ